MTLSRWKMMAVGLGVSLGGLAAIAGQCPKDMTKSSPTADAPPTLEVPVIPAAASAPKAMPPAAPATIPVPDLPPIPGGALPSLPTAPATEPVKLPDTPVSSPAMPQVLPTGGIEPVKVAPAIPDLPAPGKPTPPATPPAPPAPPGDPLLKPLPDVPPAPPAGITYPKPTPPTIEPPSKLSPPTPGGPPVSTFVPTVGAGTSGGLDTGPPSGGGTAPRPDVTPPTRPDAAPGSTYPPISGGTAPRPDAIPSNRPDRSSSDPLIPPTRAVTVPDGGTTSMEIKHAKLAATKFRILLRVGEGEPTFEVRCGDDLVLKVACEKVDVKSPEKGNGLSAVKASGKVRFAGFGAEGTCDELSFLAGSGEVVLAGGVNIKVKDKLGRVESELSADSAKYKLDPCPTGSR